MQLLPEVCAAAASSRLNRGHAFAIELARAHSNTYVCTFYRLRSELISSRGHPPSRVAFNVYVVVRINFIPDTPRSEPRNASLLMNPYANTPPAASGSVYANVSPSHPSAAHGPRGGPLYANDRDPGAEDDEDEVISQPLQLALAKPTQPVAPRTDLAEEYANVPTREQEALASVAASPPPAESPLIGAYWMSAPLNHDRYEPPPANTLQCGFMAHCDHDSRHPAER